MKTLKFTIPVLLAVTIGHLILSPGWLGASTLTTSNNTVKLTPVAQAETPANDSGLTEAALSAQFEVLIPNDPYAEQQWALSQIQLQELWQTASGGSGILVAVLDTGIDQDHEDLDGKVVVEANFTDSPTSDDVYGHGTHVAGIIAAYGNNGLGIAGVAPESRLMNVKVAGDSGGCRASTVARGIIWAVDNGASVINLSIEIKEPSPELEAAVNYAWSQGVVIIAAAGNEGSQSPVYPAYYENCIAVAATRQDNTLAPLSNYGDWVDATAPGFNIYSTLPDSSYGYKSGTSFATAYVSGLAALLFGVVTDTNGDGKLNDEVRAAIENGCQLSFNTIT
jgi:thermitase